MKLGSVSHKLRYIAPLTSFVSSSAVGTRGDNKVHSWNRVSLQITVVQPPAWSQNLPTYINQTVSFLSDQSMKMSTTVVRITDISRLGKQVYLFSCSQPYAFLISRMLVIGAVLKAKVQHSPTQNFLGQYWKKKSFLLRKCDSKWNIYFKDRQLNTKVVHS